jgi:hypothetical protein
MNSRDWFNQSLPQTLQIAVFLLYINAVFAVLNLLQIGSIRVLGPAYGTYFALRIVGGAIAGRGIAQEKKWGWILALVVAVAPFGLQYYIFGNPFAADLITLLFDIALVALLVHPQSREYERLWFK